MRTLTASLIYAFIFACLMLAGGIAHELITQPRNVLITPVPSSSRNYPYQLPTPTAKPSPRVELISAAKEVTPTKEEILQEIDRTFGGAAETAKRVAACESGLRATVQSKTGDTGVFQINQVHHIPVSQLKDYKFNIAYAYKLYQRQGFSPWKSSAKCWRRS